MTSRPIANRTLHEEKDEETPKFTGLDEAVNPPANKQQAKRLEQFDTVCEGSRQIFKKRNEDYADAIARTGALGAVVEIVGISARLEHMVLGASDAGKSQKEKVIDLAKDLHNYSAILGIMIMDDNWRPE